MTEFLAFIDESGNTALDTKKAGVSKYFTLAAIVVRREDLDALERSIEAIRSKHYGLGEIKSSNTDDRRRISVIADLACCNFKFQAVAIDKKEINPDSGLIYKKSFIKFINGILYNRLVRSYQDIEMRADQHGREEFMAQFRRYIDENHIPDLFRTSTLKHVSSHDSVLVQLADFLAGTIRKIYEGSVSQDVREAFVDLIRNKKLSIEEWPPSYAAQSNIQVNNPEFDAVIYRVAMNAASLYVSENQSPLDEEHHIQLIVLKYLLFNAKFGEGDYVSTSEILEHLASCGYADISEYQLKATVISRLRDNDVLISSSNKGYKIPQKYQDFMDFVELVNGQTIPLLERLNRARKALHTASLGNIAIFGDARHEKLRRVLDVLASDKNLK